MERKRSSTRLAVRCFGGLLQILVALGAILFLSSWSLRYWQGWVFLAVFASTVAPITLYFLIHDPALMERRLNAGPRGEKETSQKIIQSFASVFFFALFVVSGLDHRYAWSRVSIPFVILGDVIVILGLTLVFFVFKENSFTSGTIEVDAGQAVISTGPYHVLRHPMYSGALLMMIGVPLALGSLWGVLAVIPMCAVLIFRLQHEEQFLAERLPGYREYCRRTRFRLVPGIY